MSKKKKKKKWGFKQSREKLIAQGYIELDSPTFTSPFKEGCTCTRDDYIHIYEPTCKLHGNISLK